MTACDKELAMDQMYMVNTLSLTGNSWLETQHASSFIAEELSHRA